MAATKFTADGLLSTEEADPINEDTNMDAKITYEEEDALLSLVLAMTVSQTLKDRNVRGIQRTS